MQRADTPLGDGGVLRAVQWQVPAISRTRAVPGGGR